MQEIIFGLQAETLTVPFSLTIYSFILLGFPQFQVFGFNLFKAKERRMCFRASITHQEPQYFKVELSVDPPCINLMKLMLSSNILCKVYPFDNTVCLHRRRVLTLYLE